MIKHKWWHFIYGKVEKEEITYKEDNFKTTVFWKECKKCGLQIGEAEAMSSFTLHLYVKKKKSVSPS